MKDFASVSNHPQFKSGRLQRKRQGGYSLIELSIVLTIIAVVVVGGLVGTRQILLNNSVNNQIKDSTQLMGKIERHYQRQATTAGASINNLAPLGYWPSERTSVAGTTWTVRGVLSGSTEVIFPNVAAIGTLPANTGLIYTLRNIPSAGCADLINGLDALSFAIYAGVAATADPTSGTTPTSTAVKAAGANTVDPVNLATACSSVNPLVDIALVLRAI